MKIQDLVGKRVVLADGRSGIITHISEQLVSIDMDLGYWVCGPFSMMKMIIIWP